MDDLTMPDESIAQQLAKVLDRQGEMAGDVREIKVRMELVPKLDDRVSALERAMARWGAWWAAAVVFGAAFGWVAAYLSRPR